MEHRPWEEIQPSCGSAREETAPGGAHSSPPHLPPQGTSGADGAGVVPEAGTAGCLTAGKACGEKRRADSEGRLSMRKQMCVLVLQTHFSLRCLGGPSAQGWRRRLFSCES